MDRFSKFHPSVCFSFFMGAIIFTLVFYNSVFGIVSLLCAFCYNLRLKGKSAMLFLLKFIIPLVLLASIFNMLFSHYGNTVLFSVKGYSFTLESLTAGLFTGVMIGAVMIWFSSYNEIITSDKFMALFGGFAPNLTLLFSMILRFIPLMVKTAGEIKDAHKGLGYEVKGIKNALARFSALISICLEKSIETADTMKARGFGTKKRSFYSAFVFRASDLAALVFIIVFIIYLFIACGIGAMQITFDPVIEIKNVNHLPLAAFIIYALFPLAADVTEDIKWRLLKSKI